jgi:hypothetical protein
MTPRSAFHFVRADEKLRGVSGTGKNHARIIPVPKRRMIRRQGLLHRALRLHRADEGAKELAVNMGGERSTSIPLDVRNSRASSVR